jgi:hypothetical protein
MSCLCFLSFSTSCLLVIAQGSGYILRSYNDLRLQHVFRNIQ